LNHDGKSIMREKSLASSTLPGAIAELREARASGSLIVSSRGLRRELLFFSGELRSIRSSVEEEMIGSWLVQQGLLSEEHMGLVLLAQVGSNRGRSFGALVVSMGFMTQITFEAQARASMDAILERTNAATRAELTFEPRADQSEVVIDTLLDRSTIDVILAMARSYPDLAAKRARFQADQLLVRTQNCEELIDILALSPPASGSDSTIRSASAKLSRRPSLQTRQTVAPSKHTASWQAPTPWPRY
jgi:hypothetical protein